MAAIKLANARNNMYYNNQNILNLKHRQTGLTSENPSALTEGIYFLINSMTNVRKKDIRNNHI